MIDDFIWMIRAWVVDRITNNVNQAFKMVKKVKIKLTIYKFLINFDV